ncbi:GNAT family N-acetyltransferase [Vagococcus salmoninarum]|uniref:GNAT family N-acetyltransferase n=1 Tax=Vagococcus salmoninarum TaxID=2739 RepID=UPI0018818900|nr:GNAT family N-acetyltransferase [Vagococcus salmoninarum]MBE9388644.1 GNAT family N-acetyltransferase [Vagococcus salmoninarum]
MILREIQGTDNQQVKKLIQESLKSFNLAIPGTAYFDPQLGDLTSHYKNTPRSKYWVVVETNGQVLACGGYGPFGKQSAICELQKLYVSPLAQGKGLSRLLMNQIISQASQEYEGIYLETTKTLAVANLLYLKYGFKLLAEPLPGSEHGAMELWYLKEF